MTLWLDKLKNGMKKTAALFTFQGVDAAAFESVEEALLRADVGYETTEDMIRQLKQSHPKDSAELKHHLKRIVTEKIEPIAKTLTIDPQHKPFVILMIGVNGAGKTTTIGKLGQAYQEQGLNVAFVGGDTFRAGATEQLQRWGERLHIPVYTGNHQAEASGLVYEALEKASLAHTDVLLIDTAGRLHNRSDLMDELKKIRRVIQKKEPTAPHATLLVLDATSGQNALKQVDAFQDMIGVSGLIMTKLDGTAKGGILLALADRYHLPVYAIGVGESADDLQPFSAEEYAGSLIGEEVTCVSSAI